MYYRVEAALFHRIARPISTPWVLMLATLIALPTLFAGFLVDDYIHLLTLRGEGTLATPFDLFQFAPGNAEALYPFINEGPLPWYTLPELKLHFFRPLSSATMLLDHAFFGESSVFYHLHSLLWYLLLTWSVFLLYQKRMAAGLAGLCCLLYLLDEGHIIPVLWWSNRNALVAAVPAVLGLVAHLRWREEHWRPGLPLSLAGYGLGLLGGETALGIFGYLIAYELVQRRETWFSKTRVLAPAGILAVSYLIVYKMANFGVYGSGVYLDPIAEWPAYLRALPVRFADLIGAQFFSLPAELPILSNEMRLPLLATTVTATTLIAVGAVLLWRYCSTEERQLLLWMGLGSFIASLPVLATFPSGRLLLLPSIGGCAWIGLFIMKGLESVRKKRPWLIRILGRTFLLLHIVLMPAFWIVTSASIPILMGAAEDAFHEIEIDDSKITEQQAFCIFAPDPYTGFYPLVIRQYLGYPRPKGWQTLSLAPFDHELTRTASNRFEVRVSGGEMLSTPFERLLRSENFPFEAGDRVRLNGFSIDILETGDWGPRRFAVNLDHPLEDPRYVFLAWQDGHLSTVSWPPLGESTIFRVSEGYFAWPHFKKRLPLL